MQDELLIVALWREALCARIIFLSAPGRYDAGLSELYRAHTVLPAMAPSGVGLRVPHLFVLWGRLSGGGLWERARA